MDKQKKLLNLLKLKTAKDKWVVGFRGLLK